MAALLVLVALSTITCASSTPGSTTSPASGSTGGLGERVMSFSSDGDEVIVTFSRSAAIYRLPVDGDHFVDSMIAIVTAYRDQSTVTYRAQGGVLTQVTLR